MTERTDWPDARLDQLARQVEALVPLSVSIATLSANVAALTNQLERQDKNVGQRLDAVEQDVADLQPGPRENRDRKYAVATMAVGLVAGILAAVAAGLIHP